MSFDVKLQYNASPKNQIGKALTDKITLTGTLKDSCDMLNPIVIVQSDVATISACNYVYIAEFKRYYFITDFTVSRTNLVSLHLHVDVLESFKTELLKCSCITSRQKNNWNLYLNDGALRVYQNSQFQTLNFPNGFTSHEYVLAVAGGTW